MERVNIPLNMLLKRGIHPNYPINKIIGSSTSSFEHSGRLESDNKLPTLLAKLFWSLASVKVVLEGRNVGSGEG